MRTIKRKVNVFFRTVYVSSVILCCIIFGFYGICKAYENIRLIAFGEYRSAIEYKEGKLEIFDFELSFNVSNIFN